MFVPVIAQFPLISAGPEAYESLQPVSVPCVPIPAVAFLTYIQDEPLAEIVTFSGYAPEAT